MGKIDLKSHRSVCLEIVKSANKIHTYLGELGHQWQILQIEQLLCEFMLIEARRGEHPL